MSSFGHSVRDRFAIDPEVVFLNHASFGATPRSVTAARRAEEDALEAQPVDYLVRAPARIQGVMEALAPVFGAPAAELLPVDNATTGVTAVLRSLSLGPGDAILTTNLAYAAVKKVIRFVAERTGCSVVTAEVPFPLTSPDEVLVAVDAALAGPGGGSVRVAVIDHITSVTGLILPVESLVARLHARGVHVLVDGAHVPGQLPLDVTAIGADWYVGNLHKWLFSPKGCAVLHAAPQAQKALAPLVISHGWGDDLQAAFAWQGTRDPTGWLAVPAALDFVDAMGGLALIRDHNRTLAHQGATIVRDHTGFAPGAPLGMCPALVSLVVPGPSSPERAKTLVLRMLHEHRVQSFVMPIDGGVVVRVCAQIYNAPADYERLARALEACT